MSKVIFGFKIVSDFKSKMLSDVLFSGCDFFFLHIKFSHLCDFRVSVEKKSFILIGILSFLIPYYCSLYLQSGENFLFIIILKEESTFS